jgi:hypothetical protein
MVEIYGLGTYPGIRAWVVEKILYAPYVLETQK